MSVVAFALFTTGGVPATGVTPTFAAYKDSTGADRAQPTITELGGGLYTFTSTGPDDLIGTAYLITTGVIPAYYGGAVGNLIAWSLQDGAGAPLVGATPTFSKYTTFAGVAQSAPTLLNIGGGLYGFVPPDADIQTGRLYLVSSGVGAFPAYVAGTVEVQSGFVSVSPSLVPVLSADAPALDVSTTPPSVGRDLYLDTNLRELGLFNGDLVIVRDLPAIAQDLDMRLRFFKGEWFLDEDVGIDYFGRILVHTPRRDDIAQVYREAMLLVPGVTGVQSLTLSLDASRRLTVNWTVNTDLGVLNGTTLTVNP